MQRRVAAAERFASEPEPTTAAEEWRYSPIADLDLERFEPTVPDATASGTVAAAGSGEEICVPHRSAAVRLVNGSSVGADLAHEAKAAGVRVGRLADLTEGSELLGGVADSAGDRFTLLNDAFALDPLLIDVPSGVVLEQPIVVEQQITAAGSAVFPRLVVRVGSDAQVSVLDVVSSPDGVDVLVCPLVELDVGPAGRLGYLHVQQLGDSTWQLGSQVARAGRDATITAATAGLGGGYARTRADTRLVGRGASGDLLSLYFGERDQILDFRTYQDHDAPDTTSNLLYKGAVGGRSRSIYTGLIRVGPDARGTNAFQTNRNLKLSDDAWAESVPYLEIENKDVKCSHASTVSPVDPDQVFYLESRGVPGDVAERLIVAGFFDEVLTALPVPAVVPALRRAVAAKLARQAAAKAA
ncbi:MAG: SufD family Fe-S cluster assembly protein [Acidimicrobiales bacterium]